MHYYQLSRDALFERLKTTSYGLTSAEAEARLLQYGPNVLEEKHKTSPWSILFAQFKSPLIIILMIATAISMAIGHIVDGIIVLIIVVLNALFGFVQEYKAEKSMESLKKMMSLKSKVVRNNGQIIVDSTLLVPGDLVVIEEWDKIPADGYLIYESNLYTAEAALTGESLPIKKNLSVIDHDVVLGDQKNMVFSGTTVTQWNGKYIVTATGMQTQLWSIATMIDTTEVKVTHLQKRLEKLSKLLWIVVLVICLVIFCAYYFGNDLDLTTSFLASIALAVAAIPEWLPAVVTISLGLWVNRMVKKNALMRKLPSVETLWAVTTICSDKTGTLTKNEMTVTHVYVDGKVILVSWSGYAPEWTFASTTQSLEQLLIIWLLCNHAHLHENTVIWDPTEWCLIVSALKWWIQQQAINKKYTFRDENPFDSSRKMMSVLYDTDAWCTIMVKGAPEILIEKCTHILDHWVVRPLTQEDKQSMIEHNDGFAQHAMRVLWFAYKQVQEYSEEVKKSAENELIFVGLQWIIDPPRMEVKTAIETCHQAWIQVIMITGDNMQTAKAIATQLWIRGEAMQWSELEQIWDEALMEKIDRYTIFARVNPEHKQRLIKLLKKQWHVVAMTWDGVNDAPALKQADIGIAMGITGTDVSKEASDMILLDDNFTTIVGAIEEWRGIYDNIKKFVNFLLSTNLSEVLIIFMTSIMGLPLPLIAIQVLRVNLVTDWLPALALGIDPIDKNIMKRKPLNPESGIIWKAMFINIIVISLLMTAAVLYFYVTRYSVDLVMTRTGVLVLLVMLEVMRVQMIRSNYGVWILSNKRLVGAILLSLLLILLVIYTPLSVYFQTKPLSLEMREHILALFVLTTIVWLTLDYCIDRWLLKKTNKV